MSAHTLDGQEIPGPLEPLANCILVKVKDAADVSAGGIVLPDQVSTALRGLVEGVNAKASILISTCEFASSTRISCTQAKEKPTEGSVVAAGPGRLHPETAVLMPMCVKPGTCVLLFFLVLQ